MARMTLAELYLELEATDLAYVRRKLLLEGYPLAQQKFVKDWLEQREKEQFEERAARDLVISTRTAFWTKVSAITAVGVAIVSAGLFLLATTGG